jgi:hypothetical protein
MERRARELAELAIERGDPWLGTLGEPPSDPAAGRLWMRDVSTVAAYRDRWKIADDHLPLGPDSAVTTIEEMRQRTRAEGAVRRLVGPSCQSAVGPTDVGGVDSGVTTARGVEL